jgi:hypothetical protein
MLMMRNDLLLLSDEEVLSSVEAYKKSMKKKFQIKDENLNVSGTGTRGNLIRVFVKGDKA